MKLHTTVLALAWALQLSGAENGVSNGGAATIQPATVQLLGPTTTITVGDPFTFVVTGAPLSMVYVSEPGWSAPVGLTDANGSFRLSGIAAANAVGGWEQTWIVGGVEAQAGIVAGGVPATPAPLKFAVNASIGVIGPETFQAFLHFDSTKVVAPFGDTKGLSLDPVPTLHLGGRLLIFSENFDAFLVIWQANPFGTPGTKPAGFSATSNVPCFNGPTTVPCGEGGLYVSPPFTIPGTYNFQVLVSGPGPRPGPPLYSYNGTVIVQ